MKGWLIRLVRAVLYWLSPSDRPVQATGPLFERVYALCAAQEVHVGRSGEAKRHQVLSRAQKEYPELATLTISKTIDAAVEAMQG